LLVFVDANILIQVRENEPRAAAVPMQGRDPGSAQGCNPEKIE
jgi:hypothetical protein